MVHPAHTRQSPVAGQFPSAWLLSSWRWAAASRAPPPQDHSLTPQRRVRYTLKTPSRDGTTHVVFAPLDFIARLAALVPKPRGHLARYHGVLHPTAAGGRRSRRPGGGVVSRRWTPEHRPSAIGR
ncbi:MAG: hypothetical protein EXR82_04815 [Gammaproteobacteria bacterium]|nr:hypothetical protein [Gammaproteobacteria bacterium]